MWTHIVILGVTVVNSVFSANNSNPDDSNRCTLPNHPKNGQWFITGGLIHRPGDKVQSGITLKLTCNSRYTLNSPSVILCENGQWNSKIGQCFELCPPVIDTPSTIVTCTTNGNISDCKKPTNGTVATVHCAPFYENSDLNRNPFRLCNTGEWSEEIPSCIPQCGIKQEILENNSTKSFYPWNVIIYERKTDNKKIFLSFKCVGTLINEKTILTAAGCVTNEYDGTLFSPENYVVAAGKIYAHPNDSRDPGAEFSQVKDLFVPDEYKGRLLKFIGDIAIVIANTSFNMTRRIQPACLDWTNLYKEELEFPKIKTTIAGLILDGKHNLNNVQEIVLLDGSCRGECKPLPSEYQFVAETVDKYITNYHSTAAYRHGFLNNYEIINSTDDSSFCKVDVGIGLMVKNPFNEKFYVIGVLRHYSMVLKNKTCKLDFFSFTKVYDYISDFIVEKTELYTTINRASFQTSCGIKSVKAQTLILQGKNVSKSDYPWQVAIYKNSNKDLICGGSLINQRVILTAAHCVANENGETQSKEQFVVAVGKYYRGFADHRDKSVQFSTLKKIIVASQYQGEVQNYLGDIAILITETSFALSKFVQPICIDWETKYEKQFLNPNASGFVAGWGFTEEDGRPSEELKELEVPYIEQEMCKNNLPNNYEIFLTADKLCAGFLSKGKSVCKGDSGGGLVFKNKNDDRYYLAGIVSISPQALSGGCNSQQYSLYTKVSSYVTNFVLEHARLYWA